MRTLVTGAAGFIGSHLAECLVAQGHDVVGLDAFTDYYDVALKRKNVEGVVDHPRFQLVERDVHVDPIDDLLRGVEVVFHQAAQPGVRMSWNEGFSLYSDHNITGLQRVLEAVRLAPTVRRLVCASSSSVYGDAEAYPCSEESPLRPRSPYGITKLAGEHLCRAYAESWNVPVTSLRYFTVYGPRQRPDMAMHRLFEAALDHESFPLFGDGGQRRDFTYVGDVVAANLAAAAADTAPGEIFNVAGGSAASMLEVIELVSELVGAHVDVERLGDQAGDVRRTGGDTRRARTMLAWQPQVDLRTGLTRQLDWHRTNLRHAPMSSPS